MTNEAFIRRAKSIASELEDQSAFTIIWRSPTWLELEPIDDRYSISLRFEFDEISVGIWHWRNYFRDRYGDGRQYEDGFLFFTKLIRSKIKVTRKMKGKSVYSTDILYIDGEEEIFFAGSRDWLFPFWKKTILKEQFFEPLVS